MNDANYGNNTKNNVFWNISTVVDGTFRSFFEIHRRRNVLKRNISKLPNSVSAG